MPKHSLFSTLDQLQIWLKQQLAGVGNEPLSSCKSAVERAGNEFHRALWAALQSHGKRRCQLLQLADAKLAGFRTVIRAAHRQSLLDDAQLRKAIDKIEQLRRVISARRRGCPI